MPEAKITLTLTPQEFDSIRVALKFAQSNDEQVAKDRSTDFTLKREAGVRAIQLADILKRLS